jgi:hypothetical protein
MINTLISGAGGVCSASGRTCGDRAIACAQRGFPTPRSKNQLVSAMAARNSYKGVMSQVKHDLSVGLCLRGCSPGR